MSDLVPFHELATAAYCPRKLYYRRRDGAEGPPPVVERVHALAFSYPALLDETDDALAERPIDPEPARYRRRLHTLRERFGDRWSDLVDPAERDVLVAGKDCRGRVAKVLAPGGDGGAPGGGGSASDDAGHEDRPTPVHVSAGTPPEQGVWAADGVRAVAAAKALAYREGRAIERALVEYPRVGVVRSVDLTTRRTAEYRRVLRTVRRLDGPPPRIDDRAKCAACERSDACGVRTRSLGSLLGVG